MSPAFKFPRNETSHKTIFENDHLYRSIPDEENVQTENEFQRRSLSKPLLVASTCGLGGLQVVWSVISSRGAPLLISLGLSKSLTALVWIAGPLCGIVIQPLMGVLSDRCRIPWGRRRPYILSGALATILSLLFLAWSGDTLKGLLISSNRDVDSDGIRTVAIILATIGIYALNISIQPLQMGLRALIVENCARHQQAQASAWASCLTGLGNIVGYLAGFTDLPSLFPSSSITQFQGLCLIASVSLAITVGMSCIAVSENDPESMLLAPGENLKFTSFLRQLLRTSRTMPWRIRRVCQVQFCAWMGWYPFLFYSTTYISDLYSVPILIGDSSLSSTAKDRVHEDGLYSGTFASLIFAIVAVLANSILPLFVSLNTGTLNHDKHSTIQRRSFGKFDVASVWMASHLLFAIAMFSTILVTSPTGGTYVIGCVGLSWAMTLWAPFAIIGAEITKHNGKSGEDYDTGTILSLHNLAISAPQLVSALICSGVFWVAHQAGSSDATGWALRVGGFAILAAAWLCRRLIFED